MRISTDGHKYLGGHFGSEQGKNEYIQSLLERWPTQLRVLSHMRSMSLKQPTPPSCPDSVTDLPTISARFQIFNINCSRLTTSSTLNCFLHSRPAEIFPCKHVWEVLAYPFYRICVPWSLRIPKRYVRALQRRSSSRIMSEKTYLPSQSREYVVVWLMRGKRDTKSSSNFFDQPCQQNRFAPMTLLS